RPVRAIEAAVLDRFRDVLGLEVWSVFEVRDGTGYFQDAVVGPGAEPLLSHGALEEAFAVSGQFAEGADVARGHLGVAVYLFARGSETCQLFLPGLHDAPADLGRVLGFTRRAHFFVVHRWDVDVNIDAVHQRPGDFRDIALDHRSRALAVAGAVIVKAAGTGIHRGGEHEARGESQRHGSASDTYRAVFQGLAQDFEDIAGKFWEFIQK